MDEPGKKLFARPAFALNQNTCIRLCALFMASICASRNIWIFADQPVDSLEPLDFLSQAGDFIFQTGVFERVLDGQLEFIEVDRFDQVVESALLYCHNNVFYPFVGGYHDNGRGGAQFIEPGQQFKAASVGKSDIEQNQVGIFAFGKREPAVPGIGFQNDMCFSEESAQCGAEGRFVVNNQNFVFFAHYSDFSL